MAKIGVFDSGVGGITVLKEIIKNLPGEEIIYYGDNKYAPYGNRTVENIRELCLNIGEFLVKSKVDAIVIACNTATAASIDILKERFPFIPILGVIEAGARVAEETTASRCTGILATPATVAMGAYPRAIQSIDSSLSVIQRGCPEFCPMIEDGWEDTLENEEIVKGHLSHIPEQADTLVLGCTHYPIIKNIIARFFKGRIVDPAEETAISLRKELLLNSIKINESGKGHTEFYVSGDTEKFQKVAESFLGQKIEKIYQIDLSAINLSVINLNAS
ncbi:glutamate racemase [uncultured Ilyobacter sp.]|uniref:glutamate racemase n=1 Tax=uncultured Ilyobacter sp. TaxID=544433 RepID=UPI0029C6715E|nr:glutamate racemase [uncultured Ilyobacter sp.]